jgi:segregation and condensation protein B
MARLASTIEAILYLKAQALTLTEIAEFAGCDRDGAEEGLLELMADYAHRDTALEVAETDLGYCLQLREDFQSLVQTIIPADIGKGSLRTLAVIALRGPMIQTDLINLRGSGAYQHVQELVEQGFIRKRRKSDGRSYWLQVTEKFRQYFQINQLVGNLDEFMVKASGGPAAAVEAGLEAEAAGPSEAAVALESGLESGPESGLESGLESGPESGLESGPESGPESGLESGLEPEIDEADIEEEVAGSISDAVLEAEDAAAEGPTTPRPEAPIG